MAKSAKNIVLHGASGKIGDQIVIRQRHGQTILAQAPGEMQKPPTPAQQAVVYGRGVMQQPGEKAEYAEKAAGPISAFNVAVADFMQAPHIDEIDLTGYRGQAGDPIRVRATDDFKVALVRVSIHNADGTLVEEGDAAQQPNKLDWVYTATALNNSTVGDKITVRATDKPGRAGEQEMTLS
jgi:hypothetical protein